ncbi:hypothetical protein Tco_0031472 [Tanacetum coccineum]
MWCLCDLTPSGWCKTDAHSTNFYLKDFLKLVDSLDLDVTNRERTRLRLFQFFLRDQASNWIEHLPAGSISTWEDLTTPWATIEELARYEDEGWNDPVFPEEESLDYKNPNIKQLLGVMECKVDMLMKNAISLMGRIEDVCGTTSDMMRQLPPEPSGQEDFEDLVMNFILDQEEKFKQLE